MKRPVKVGSRSALATTSHDVALQSSFVIRRQQANEEASTAYHSRIRGSAEPPHDSESSGGLLAPMSWIDGVSRRHAERSRVPPCGLDRLLATDHERHDCHASPFSLKAEGVGRSGIGAADRPDESAELARDGHDGELRGFAACVEASEAAMQSFLRLLRVHDDGFGLVGPATAGRPALSLLRSGPPLRPVRPPRRPAPSATRASRSSAASDPGRRT